MNDFCLKVKVNQTISYIYNLTIFDYCYILQSPIREKESKETLPHRDGNRRRKDKHNPIASGAYWKAKGSMNGGSLK